MERMVNEARAEVEQFPLDEILDEDERMARAWITVEVKDKQGEVIPISEIKRSLNTWLDRGGFIIDAHSNRVVGKGLRWVEAIHPITKKPGIYIDYKIFRNYSIDDEVWDEIKRGIRRGMSFGGRALKKPKTKVVTTASGESEPARELHGLEAYEMSTVRNPANPLATNIAVNFLAKGSQDEVEMTVDKQRMYGIERRGEKYYVKTPEGEEEFNTYREAYERFLELVAEQLRRKEDGELVEDLSKGFEVIDVQKPFAGFKDFNECVNAQKRRGHSEESAKRICGWLKARTEKEEIGREKQISVTPDRKLSCDLCGFVGDSMSEMEKHLREVHGIEKVDKRPPSEFISDTDKAYIAGLIDGEGYIGIMKHNKPTGIFFERVLKVANTNKECIEFIQKKFGGRIDIMKGDEKKKEAFQLVMYGENVIKTLKEVYPYLIVKKKQANVLFDFISKNKENQEQMYNKILELNKKGR